MKWTIPNPATCIGIWMISSLCGTVIFVAWRIAACIFTRRGYFYFFYKLLRMMPIFFCFPSIILLLCLQLFQDPTQSFFLFESTQPVRVAASIYIFIWVTGTLCILGFYLYTIIRMQLLGRRKIPCKRETMQLYESVCQKVRAKHFPELYLNYEVKVPVLTGLFRPKIYLPVSDWPTQQLPVIFTHELNHYKQGDIWLKRLTSLLLAVQWMNPAVWVFQKTVVLWSEYACDWLSYPLCGGKKQYFQVITSIAEKRKETQNIGVSALFKNIGELERRVQHVQWCGKKRNGAVWISALLTIIIATVGAIATYHATTIAAKESYYLYLATEDRQELPQAPPQTEFHDDGPLEGVRVQYGATDDKENELFFYKDFEWELDEHTMYHTNTIKMTSTSNLTIMIRTAPSGKDIRAGYIDEDGKRLFVNMSDHDANILKIPQDGMYKLFIENISNSHLKVCGTFTIINENEDKNVH